MTERTRGFYWVKTESGDAAEIAEWRLEGNYDGAECRWYPCGDERWMEDVSDVLAGPLQAPMAKQDVSRIEHVARRLHDSQMYAAIGLPDVPYEAVSEEVRHALRKMAERAIEAVDSADMGASKTNLRSRARALLGGTTSGPWTWDGDGVDGPRYEMVARAFVRADGAFIAGAHALLTELAKEEA